MIFLRSVKCDLSYHVAVPPCEKLAWLCTHILSELLNHVPSHLNNIFEHLNKLADIPPAQLDGKKFCSGIFHHSIQI